MRNVCWMCAGKLIWRGGHMVEDFVPWGVYPDGKYKIMVTELECTKCESWVEYKTKVEA